MPTSEPVLSEWDEARRLSGRNFQCQRCDQRWNEADLRWQDGYYMCIQNCYEENGGEIDRTIERSRGAALAADLTTKEMRPPKQAGWWDDKNVIMVTALSPDPVILVRGGSSVSLNLTGVGMTNSDTVSLDDAQITVASSIITPTSVTLNLQAGASARLGDHSITYNGATFQGVISVR